MKWFRYRDNVKNFAFILSKQDGLDEDQKQENLDQMVETLGINETANTELLALSVPPKASFGEVENDLKLLKELIFTRQTEQRIHIKTQPLCTIL